MAIRSFPYMSIKEDNKITASNEAERIDQIVDSGIIFDVLTSFECSNGTGPLDVKIAAGSAIIKGHAVISDAEEIKTVSEKDTNPRIDLIVLESNTNTDVRAASIQVIKGTPDVEENLVEPSLSDKTGVSQIKLATVFVPASGTNEYVTITDARAACLGKHNHKLSQITDMVDNMYKNGFINGDFQVWQVGSSIEPSSENKWYTADMWKCKRTDAVGGITALQTDYTSLSVTAKHALRVKRNNGDTLLNPINIAYNFGTVESMKYRGKKITVSFSSIIGENASGTFMAYIYGGTGTDEDILNGYTGQVTLASYELIPTNSFQTFTFTTPDLIDTTITELAFMVVYTPTASATGEYDHIDITNCNWSATDFYIPFSPRSFTQELQDCMAYYEKSYEHGVAPGSIVTEGMYIFHGSTDGNGAIRAYCPFTVTKVKKPSITIYRQDGTANEWNYKRSDASGTTTINNDLTTEKVISGYLVTGGSWCAANILGHWVADARI